MNMKKKKDGIEKHLDDKVIILGSESVLQKTQINLVFFYIMEKNQPTQTWNNENLNIIEISVGLKN